MNWTKAEVDILKENYGKITLNNLCKLLPNRTKKGIAWQSKKYKLSANRNITNRIYFCNDDYFKIPNIENCYWAGFIAADGCISNSSLYFYQAEKGVIEKFRDCINYNGNISHRIRTNGSQEYSICISSKELTKDLENNFNITKCKTFTLQPPNKLQDELLILSYIIGYIDGDGSISIINSKRNTYLSFGITCNKSLADWIKIRLCNIPMIHQRKECNEGVYKVYSSWKKAEQILYKLEEIKELKDLRLTRKWDKVVNWRNREY